MSMDPYNVDFCDLLKELVNEGRVKMSRIDDAVSRIVRMKIRLGLFDKKIWDMPYKKYQKLYPDFASQKFADAARGIAQECMVLLKNDPVNHTAEPVLIFVSDVVASLTPDVKRLRNFKKVTLDAGEEKEISVKVKIKDLAFVNEDMQWVVEPGVFRISVGNLNTTVDLK